MWVLFDVVEILIQYIIFANFLLSQCRSKGIAKNLQHGSHKYFFKLNSTVGKFNHLKSKTSLVLKKYFSIIPHNKDLTNLKKQHNIPNGEYEINWEPPTLQLLITNLIKEK